MIYEICQKSILGQKMEVWNSDVLNKILIYSITKQEVLGRSRVRFLDFLDLPQAFMQSLDIPPQRLLESCSIFQQ